MSTDFKPMLNPTVVLWDGRSRFGHDPGEWCRIQCKHRVDVVANFDKHATTSIMFLSMKSYHLESFNMKKPSALFMFEDPDDAMMFKMVWCGE